MNSTMRIKEEMDQEGTIVKEEPLENTVTMSIATTGESTSQQADLQSGVQCKVKEELFHEDDLRTISSKQAAALLIVVKEETCPCDCTGDCDVCLEALLSASDEEMVAGPVANISIASTFNSHAECRPANRSIGRSGKSPAPKCHRIVPASEVAVQLEHQENDDSEADENNESDSESIKLRIIVRRLKCPVPGCKKMFKNKDFVKAQLDVHLKAKHAIEKCACKVKDCTESYATWAELKVHRDSVHGHLGTNWPCGQCETTCSSYKKLRDHVYYYHEEGQFACSADKCNYSETTRIKVQIHHTKHRPVKYRPAKYGCTFAGCSSSFYNPSNLTSHFRSHTKEKPFACSQCHKAFSQKSNLTTHERIHAGIKPFLCSHCLNAFTQKIDLTRHERTHSGLKPYSCTWPHCDYSANQQSSVIKHVRTVHFHLPPTKKEQTEECITDDRDPRTFVGKTVINGN